MDESSSSHNSYFVVGRPDESDYDEEYQPIEWVDNKIVFQSRVLKTVTTSSTKFEDCSICLEQFTTDILVVQLGCKHVFHIDCLSNWIT